MSGTSILTDIELDAAAGGSVGLSFLQGMAAGAGGMSPGGSRPNFGAGMNRSGSAKPCNSNIPMFFHDGWFGAVRILTRVSEFKFGVS